MNPTRIVSSVLSLQVVCRRRPRCAPRRRTRPRDRRPDDALLPSRPAWCDRAPGRRSSDRRWDSRPSRPARAGEARGLQATACIGRRPVVLVADQDQQRHVDVAVEGRRAARIVGDAAAQPAPRRGRSSSARRAASSQPPWLWPIRPIRLLHHARLARGEPVERAGDVGDAHLAVTTLAVAAHALVAARPEAIGRQHDVAPTHQQTGPRHGCADTPSQLWASTIAGNGPSPSGSVRPAREFRSGRDVADRDRREAHGFGPRDAGGEDEQQDREDAAHDP